MRQIQGEYLVQVRLQIPVDPRRESENEIGPDVLETRRTGYGYGMDDAVSFTERLMDLFARQLTSRASMPVGRHWSRPSKRT